MKDEPKPYETTMAELESTAHVPADQQTEEQPGADSPSSEWAWDEERRQARLAGGA